MIELTGNNLLSAKDYLAFARLDNASEIKSITLPVVKDRLEKHPYTDQVDVEYNGENKINVVLKEKKIKAVLLTGTEPLFITDNFFVLPLLPNTRFIDLPIISNPEEVNKIKPQTKVNNNSITNAFKIIDAAKLTNKEIFKKLSEVNLRNGGDIILTFSGMKPPVIFGKGEEAKKMVYFELVSKGSIGGKSLMEESDYIDLRFANEIYVGSSEKIGLSE